MERSKMVAVHLLLCSFTAMALSGEARSQSVLNEAGGSVGKARQELQRLGTEAAEEAKKAEQAAQQAERFAEKLSGGQAKNDAQQAARDARASATQAKSKADQIQSQTSSEDVTDIEGLKQTVQDVKRLGAQAQGHAQKARGSAGLSDESGLTSDQGTVGR
jgi:membrane protein involved in colicin uptake